MKEYRTHRGNIIKTERLYYDYLLRSFPLLSKAHFCTRFRTKRFFSHSRLLPLCSSNFAIIYLPIFDFIYREDERVNTIFLPSLLKRNSVKKRDKSRPVAVSKRKRNEKIEHKHFPLRKNIKDRDALYFRVLPKFPTCRARNYSSF